MCLSCCQNDPLVQYISNHADVWFPDDRCEQIKSIAIGIIVGLTSFLVVVGVFLLIKSAYPGFSPSTDAMKILDLFKGSHPFLHIAWQATMKVYAVIIGPALEEIICRGILNEAFRSCSEEETTVQKICRVILVALIFGAMHLSPFQNTMTNVYILSMASAMGLVLGIIRELRDDLYAPIATHMVFNLAAV